MSGLRTSHRVLAGDARALALPEGSVDLVVTSPPYPMIAMWDEVFAALDPRMPGLLATDPAAAFEAQHATLDAVWAECRRLLRPGGLLCVNVGDATRTLDGVFRLWSNHARILRACEALGFHVLPDVLWRKPTNAPNKFMGSGMLPGGAYVTYEHEYVLVLRNGPGRTFATADEKRLRRQSAYFWEERNVWFSDVWMGLAGTDQGRAGATPRGGAARGARAARRGATASEEMVSAGAAPGGGVPGVAALGPLFAQTPPPPPDTPAPEAPPAPPRERSAAFPLELPWRLVHMYSVYGDVVLDPFAGTGTTALAAACAGRSSVSVEREPALAAGIRARLAEAPRLRRATGRLAAHRRFVDERLAAGKPFAHHNAVHDTPVVTSQERELTVWEATGVERGDDVSVMYQRV